jgi:PAS domain S-box-containing protein
MPVSKRKFKQEFQIIIVVTVFVVIAAFLTFINQVSDRSLMGVKAYISGEGQWTKAQKQATQSLTNYVVLGDDVYFEIFLTALEVSKGNKQARIELSGDNPDLSIAKEGLLAGKNPDQNIPNLIWTFNYFKNISFMIDAIRIWEDADALIEALEEYAYKIRALKKEGELDSIQTRIILQDLMELDEEFTELENAFSAQLSFIASEIEWLMTIIRVFGTLLLMIFGATIIIFNFKRTNELLKTITESEAKLSHILTHSKDIIFKLDLDSLKYDFISSSMKDMLGYNPEEVLKDDVNFILSKVHPDDHFLVPYEDVNGRPIPIDLENKTNTYSEMRVKNIDNEYIWVSTVRNIIRDEDSNPVSIVGSVRNITDKKITEDLIANSLKEKELLLSEIHHRVKNNLAIISALLELQSDKTVELEAKEALQNSQSRIRSIALVHEMLYNCEDFSRIDLRTYVETLLSRISYSYDPDKNVQNILDVDEVKMSIVYGVPFGLLLNELITNSFKHAFINSDSNRLIRLAVKQTNNQAIVEYCDNGQGISPDAFEAMPSETGLGVTLIKALIQQLNGSYNIDNSKNGFNITLRFEI